MLALTAPTVEDTAALLNFEQLAKILGGGVAGQALVADANGNAAWSSRGPSALRTVAKSGAYAAVTGDLVRVTAAGVTITLPSAATPDQIIGVVNVSGTAGSPTTVASASNITGPGVSATSFSLGFAGAFAVMQSDGANWNIISGGMDTGWIGLPYQTGVGTGNWHDVGGTTQVGQYRKTPDGIVHVRGGVANTTGYAFPATNLTIAILPAGFRPAANEAFVVWQKDSANQMSLMPLAITSSGGVALTLGNTDVVGSNNGSAAYVMLGGISFPQSN